MTELKKKKKKKGNRDSILNLSKSKRKNLQIVISGWWHIYVSFIWDIGSGMATQQSFLESMSKLSSSRFGVCYTTQCGCMNCCFVVKASAQMPSWGANNANLDKNNFDIFYQIDCCAAIYGRMWTNNAPNESRITMLSCTEIILLYLFRLWEILSQTRVSFLTHTVYIGSYYQLCNCGKHNLFIYFGGVYWWGILERYWCIPSTLTLRAWVRIPPSPHTFVIQQGNLSTSLLSLPDPGV